MKGVYRRKSLVDREEVLQESKFASWVAIETVLMSRYLSFNMKMILGLYLTEVFNKSTVTLGWFLAVSKIFGMLGCLICPVLGDHFRFDLTMTYQLLPAAISIFFMGFAGNGLSLFTNHTYNGHLFWMLVIARFIRELTINVEGSAIGFMSLILPHALTNYYGGYLNAVATALFFVGMLLFCNHIFTGVASFFFLFFIQHFVFFFCFFVFFFF